MFHSFLKILKWGAGAFAFFVVAALGSAAYIARDLPSVETLRSVTLQTPLRVYTSDGKLLALFGEKRRIPLRLEDVPPRLLQAFIAAEDADFLSHGGIDYMGLLRAAYMLAKTGEKRHGGSTITMQIARNFFLGNERTFERKIKEIILALKIERQFSKEEILSLYLNKIFLGNQAYGIGAAAEVYYGKKVDDLTLPQAAMIAGLPKAPSRYNPLANRERATERRNYVLRRMFESNFISETDYEEARRAPVSAQWHRAQLEVSAPYVAEMVRAQLIEEFGTRIYTDGFAAWTSVDSRLQTAANKSVYDNLLKYDRRHGYRGPEGRVADGAGLQDFRIIGDLYPAQVISLDDENAQLMMGDGIRVDIGKSAYQWARERIDENRRGAWPQRAADVMAVGDIVRLRLDDKKRWRLSQLPDIQGALVSLDAQTGRVLALVGGFEFRKSKFNRATQAQRQAGSGFKPFVYAVALEQGYTPASMISDAPIVVAEEARTWRPSNYSRSFKGPMRLRKALAQSNNLAAINLTDAIGLKTIREGVLKFGFTRDALPDDLTMALGSGQVTPYVLAQAYTAFANGGYALEPHLIKRLELSGEVVYRVEPPEYCPSCLPIEASTPTESVADEMVVAEGDSTTRVRSAQRVLSSDVNYQMVSLLKDVIRYGTGKRARALNRKDIAGKTGTTNNQRDAWFSGFSPDIVTVAWVGFDDFSPMGKKEVGGVAALPMWIDYMREALKDRPQREYYRPPNIVDARIDPDNGLLAQPQAKGSIVESFRSEHVPKRFSPLARELGEASKQNKLF